MCNRRRTFIFHCVVLLGFAACSAPLAAKNFTFSDEQLMALDWDGAGWSNASTSAKITARRDIPELGVEFDVWFSADGKRNRDTVYCISSIYGGTGKFTGIGLKEYEKLALDFTLLKVNVTDQAAEWGPVAVGSLINGGSHLFGYRPEFLSTAKTNQNAVSATSVTDTETVESIGFMVSLYPLEETGPQEKTPQDIELTILVKPTPGADILSFDAEDDTELIKAAKKTLVVPDDYPSIQAAIDAAVEGTVVKIKPGQYEEILTLKSKVHLSGLDANEVIIRCSILDAPVLRVIDCNTCEIANLTLMHTGLEYVGEDFEAMYPILLLRRSQANVIGCTISHAAETGIAIDGGQCVIRNCTASDNAEHGLIAYGGAKVIMENNRCLRNGKNGIYLLSTKATAYGNLCRENSYNGISANSKTATITLTGNNCSDNGYSGIYTGSQARGLVSGNICYNNELNGISVAGKDTNITVENNKASGNKGSGIGFFEGASGAAIGNTCTSNVWHGISIADRWVTAKITGNTCTDNSQCGLYIENSYKSMAKGNTIKNNQSFSFGEIASILWDEDLDTLEEIASVLRKEKKRYPNGNWQLSYFYSAIGGGGMEHRNFDDVETQLQQWVRRDPNSITARIALARAIERNAWRHRGGGYAYEVSEKGWKLFEENLRKADSILAEAEKLQIPDPDLYVVWLDLGRGLGFSDEQMDTLFEKGIAIERNYWPLYTTRGFALTPIWGGSVDQLEAFARKAVELTRSDEQTILYAKIAQQMIGKKGWPPPRYRQIGFSYELLSKSYDDLIRLYPAANDNDLLNTACFLACAYEKKEQAALLFAKIQQNWTRRIWENETDFNKYRDWALGSLDSLLGSNKESVEQESQ